MMRLKLLSRRYPGEKVHTDSDSLRPDHPRLVQSLRKTTRKSYAPHAKQHYQSRASVQRWSGWQHRLHCGNPVHKIPRAVHGAYSSSLLLSGQQRSFQNTHSQHPAAAGKEWSLLKCSSSLCVPVSRSWMPSVLCVARNLSTKGHRLSGSDRCTVRALTLSNPELN